jgi:hemerythrin-like domain-containing protein
LRPFLDDHRDVQTHLDRVERVVLGTRRTGRLTHRGRSMLCETVELLKLHIATHMTAEDEVLFPALEDFLPGGKPSLDPLREEHRELRLQLTSLDELAQAPADRARDEQILVQARDFVDLLRLHIHKEEAAIFTMASRVLSPRELEMLSERIAGRHAHPPRPRPRRAGSKGNRS